MLLNFPVSIRGPQRKLHSCINEQTTSDRMNHSLVSLLVLPAVSLVTTICANTPSRTTVCQG